MLLLIFLLALPIAAGAQTAQPTPNDPVANKRAVQLAEELRCLVCQNQTIADSNAELAVDLRRQIREQIAQGRSDGQIVDYMVERYGDFVLYRPPVKASTWFLWLGPFVLLLAGLAFFFFKLKQRQRRLLAAPQGLDEDEHKRAQALLASDENNTARGS